MKFEQALQHLREGKKIKRKEWSNVTAFTIFNTEGGIDISSLLAEDWEVVEPQKEISRPTRPIEPKFTKGGG